MITKTRRSRGTGIVALAAVGALFAGIAYGATANVSGDLYNNSSDWKTFNTIRTKVGTGNINMNLTNTIQPTFYMRVRYTMSNSVSGGNSWPGSTLGNRNIATNVPDGTTFKVEAKSGSAIFFGGDTFFAGTLTF
jgi:hypothetical protein